MKEMVKVISSLIGEIKRLSNNLANVEFLVDSFFEWKDEKGDLKKYVEQRIEKLNKDRDNDSTPDK